MALARPFAIAFSLCALSCAQSLIPMSDSSVLQVRRVSVDQKTVEVDESAKLTFQLTQPAAVQVKIRRGNGEIIRTFSLPEQQAAEIEVAWDGKDDVSQPVTPGVYLYAIETQSAGRTAQYGAAAIGGGEEVLARRFTFDREKNKLHFALPAASYVRLRTGIRGLPVMNTTHDWIPLEAGEHVIPFEGMDKSGLFNLRKHPNLDINLTAFSLPANSIIVSGPEGMAARTDEHAWVDRGASFRHANHAPEDCHEPRFSIAVPTSDAPAKDGSPVVSGIVPVRINIHADDEAHLINTRFEAMVFIDTIFLFEEEEATSPFTYQLDTRALAPGPHLLTVNLLSYDDHVGIETIQFIKKDTR